MRNRYYGVFLHLLHKNFRSRTRHWILTVILEIAMPLLLFRNVWSIGDLVPTMVSENQVDNQQVIGQCKAKLFIVSKDPFVMKLADRMDYCLITKIKKLTSDASQVDSCYYVASETKTFDSEEDLYEVYRSFYPRKEDTWSGYAFTASLIFQDETDETNLKYTIKIPIPLPKELYGKPSNNPANSVYERGYAAFQLCVDEEFIKIKNDNSNFTLQIEPQEMPNPPDLKPDIAYGHLRHVLCVVAMIAFLIPMCVESFFISNERFAGINMLLSLNNIPNFLNLLSWIVSGLVIGLLYTIPITILLVNHSTEDILPLLHYENPWIFLMVITTNVVHLITFGMHVSAYFIKPSFSIVTIFVLYVSSTILLKCGTDENTVATVPFFGIFFPNTLLLMAFEEFNYYEKMEKLGIHWNNIFEVGNRACGIQGSVGMILVFSILGIIFHFAMANYMYAINPDEYGVKKSPFSFIKFFMNIKKSHDYAKVENMECNRTNRKWFEPVQDNCVPEIKIRKLTKSYRISSLNRVKKCALRNVSIDFFKNQTTVLLGHSGSGKTTLLSMLTGSSGASEGFILINGKIVRHNSNKRNQDLGFCLQNNIVFPHFSVVEQLCFFNVLKNPTKSEPIVSAEVTALLKKLKLTNESSALPTELSIAQKRRLCLGIALIGNPKILILDEPTLGVDAESKRDIWNLLLKMNGEKTILISTRDMEEADVLGDRVAMLHEGELKFYGTPNYLKKSLGKGNLQVTLSTDSDCEPQCISDYFDPNSRVTEISHGQINLSVPDNNDLPDSLDKIQHHKKELGVTGITVSNSTLEQVYLKVTRSNSVFSTAQGHPGSSINISDSKNYILNALIHKKAVYTINNIAPILITIIMFFLLSLLSASLVLRSESIPRKIEIPVKLDIYKKVTAYFSDQNYINDPGHHLARNYKTIVEEQQGTAVAFELNFELFKTELQIRASGNNAFDYAYHSLVAVGFDISGNNKKAVALYNACRARFTLPISINLASNALLKYFVGPDYSIDVVYEELAAFKDDTLVSNLTANARFDGYAVGMIIAFFLFPAVSLFVAHPLGESLSSVKHLQRMAGVSAAAYWGTMFAFDFVIFLPISVLFLVKFVMADIIFSLDMFGWQETLIQLMLFILFAVNTLPFIYAFSFWKKSKSFTIALLSLLPLGLVLVDVSIGTLKLHFHDDNGYFNGLRSLQKAMFLLTPYVGFFHGQVSFFKIAKVSADCRKLRNLANDRVCKLTPCCSMGCVDGACSKAVSYFNNFEDDVSLETCVLYMCLTPILYFAVLCILECKLIPKALAKIHVKMFINADETAEEQVKKIKHEIAFEASKVREKVSNGTTINGNLNTVENGSEASSSGDKHVKKSYEFFAFELKKLYGNVAAVQDASFGVQRGECFGLIGESGVGKSTILKMIVGEEIPNRGMLHLRDERDLKKLGYCPQNFALVKTLNAYDHLRLFARLRGIAERKVDREVAKWIERLDLNDCASQPSETYSDGNKKRLNIAMAFVGNPKLILLDEPTKNLDPATKQSLWKLIRSCQATGQSIILASNSMAECLALCRNYAAMGNGKFVYIGSPSESKQRFGIGYDVQLKLNLQTTNDSIRALSKNLNEALPCEMIRSSPKSIKFHVIPVEITWRKMYDLLLEMRNEFPCIEGFTVITSSSE